MRDAGTIHIIEPHCKWSCSIVMSTSPVSYCKGVAESLEYSLSQIFSGAPCSTLYVLLQRYQGICGCWYTYFEDRRRLGKLVHFHLSDFGVTAEEFGDLLPRGDDPGFSIERLSQYCVRIR